MLPLKSAPISNLVYKISKTILVPQVLTSFIVHDVEMSIKLREIKG